MDWPTYQADFARSGVSPDRITLPLTEAWDFRSVHPPPPAWSGEAKRDAYSKINDLRPRQIFDKAFHVVAAGGLVYFGSSADDKVYCLEASSGKERWNFYTEGPVRLAPTVSEGKIYFGSDDGFVYCLEAGDGTLVWKTRPGPRDYRIPGNGRVISAWPGRTSVVVRDSLAYGCAGMFPSEGVYLFALETKDGSVRWKVVGHDLPAQGYMLASETRLYVPAGRDNPVVYNRSDGQRLRSAPGTGATYALLTGDTLTFGPGKTGQLGVVVEEGVKDQLASFSGNHMIVTPGLSYLHSDKELSALDRVRYLGLTKQRGALAASQREITKKLKELQKRAETPEKAKLKEQVAELGKQIDATSQEMSECVPWKQPCRYPLCLILAGQALVAGGEGEIGAFNAGDGQQIWKGAVTGKAFGLAASGGRLYASTDQGTIHCFSSAASRASAGGRTPSSTGGPRP